MKRTWQEYKQLPVMLNAVLQRQYDPETGRWLPRDPILFKGKSTNLCGYAVNDPINNTDQSGLLFNGYSTYGSCVGAEFATFRANTLAAQQEIQNAQQAIQQIYSQSGPSNYQCGALNSYEQARIQVYQDLINQLTPLANMSNGALYNQATQICMTQ